MGAPVATTWESINTFVGFKREVINEVFWPILERLSGQLALNLKTRT